MTLPFKIRSASVTPKAKYGDETVNFDLNHPEPTTASRDVNGQESTARYPGSRRSFRKGGAGSRPPRGDVLLPRARGPAACLIFGGKGAKDANLPITVGPQKTPPLGPRDRL